MYINTNPRYRRRRGFSLGRVLFWILAPILIAGGIGIYQNRETFIPIVNQWLDEAVEQANEVVTTLQAPTPAPTADPAERLVRAEALWEQGAFQEALTLYEAVIDALPNDVKAHSHLTMGYIVEGRIPEAAAAAENTVTANPFSADAWTVRAMALNRSGRSGDALASALRALELNPNSAAARAAYAEALFDLGQIERANLEVERAFELNPDSYEAFFVRSRINSESRFNFTAAKRDLTAAYELSGGMTHIGVLLALEDLVREGGDAEAGLARLREMNERNPNNPDILERLGRYYRSNGNRDQALSYLTRCVSSIPSAIGCHFWLGRLQSDAENIELAAESFKKAIDLGSNNPQHYYWAATSQQNLGNCGAATDYFERGYELAKETGTWVSDIESAMRSSQCSTFNLPTLAPTVAPETTDGDGT